MVSGNYMIQRTTALGQANLQMKMSTLPSILLKTAQSPIGASS